MAKVNLLKAQRRILESSLTANQKLVAFALLDHWSEKQGEMFPSVPRLAALTSLGVRTVKRAVVGLEAAGVVQVKRALGHPNRYRMDGAMTLTSAKQSPGADRCQSGTSVTAAPVPERHGSSAKCDREPVPERHTKEPSEGTQEGTNFRAAKKSRRASKKKENTPHPHAQELKIHYIEEFERTRGDKPGFGSDWSRAMMSLGKLADKVGLEGAKRVITNALGQKATESYRPPVEPWDLVKRCNTFLGTAKKTSSAPQRGMAAHIETGVFDV